MSAIREIRTLSEGGTLSALESEGLFNAIFQGAVSEIEMAAAVVALKVRRETPEEILGAVRSMRAFASPLELCDAGVFDTCGTGGDNSGSFNVSSAVALTMASLGVPVAKHGNRSVSSRSGSADFLEALGVPIGLTGAEAAEYFRKRRFVFLFAPNYHPAMRHAGAVRKALGVRTIFNYLGPLTNPAGPPRQAIGVFHPAMLPLYAGVAAELKYDCAVIYSAEGGMDEVSPVAPTEVRVVSGRRVRSFTIDPSRFITAAEAETLPRNLTAAENAERFVETIESPSPTPLGRLIALNTALALFAHRDGGEIETHYATALDAIHGGAVMATLSALRDNRNAH
ncbi:MAG: anthranilate phosphoribosyltransferase [Spirochaetes bacterium]|jgi:anthranilate phosphoribosyltransferase|nr:anthranilate phosphoribosyltransferase [Spirochaetota bacterium]